MKFTPAEQDQIERAFAHFSPPPKILYEDDNGDSYATPDPDSEEGFSLCKNSRGTFHLFESGVLNDEPDEYLTLEEVLTEAVELYQEYGETFSPEEEGVG